MKLDTKFIQALIKHRITIICLFLAGLFTLGFWIALILGVTSEEFELSRTISSYIPTVIIITVVLLISFYLVTGILKARMESKSMNSGKDETGTIKTFEEAMSFGYKKVRIFYACLGSFIALAIITSFLFILLGYHDYLETVFMVLFYIGGPVWFLTTWRYFSRKLD